MSSPQAFRRDTDLHTTRARVFPSSTTQYLREQHSNNTVNQVNDVNGQLLQIINTAKEPWIAMTIQIIADIITLHPAELFIDGEKVLFEDGVYTTGFDCRAPIVKEVLESFYTTAARDLVTMVLMIGFPILEQQVTSKYMEGHNNVPVAPPLDALQVDDVGCTGCNAKPLDMLMGRDRKSMLKTHNDVVGSPTPQAKQPVVIYDERNVRFFIRMKEEYDISGPVYAWMNICGFKMDKRGFNSYTKLMAVDCKNYHDNQQSFKQRVEQQSERCAVVSYPCRNNTDARVAAKKSEGNATDSMRLIEAEEDVVETRNFSVEAFYDMLARMDALIRPLVSDVLTGLSSDSYGKETLKTIETVRQTIRSLIPLTDGASITFPPRPPLPKMKDQQMATEQFIAKICAVFGLPQQYFGNTNTSKVKGDQENIKTLFQNRMWRMAQNISQVLTNFFNFVYFTDEYAQQLAQENGLDFEEPGDCAHIVALLNRHRQIKIGTRPLLTVDELHRMYTLDIIDFETFQMECLRITGLGAYLKAPSMAANRGKRRHGEMSPPPKRGEEEREPMATRKRRRVEKEEDDAPAFDAKHDATPAKKGTRSSRGDTPDTKHKDARKSTKKRRRDGTSKDTKEEKEQEKKHMEPPQKRRRTDSNRQDDGSPLWTIEVENA